MAWVFRPELSRAPWGGPKQPHYVTGRPVQQRDGFEVVSGACPLCGAERRVVGFVTEPSVIMEILAHPDRRGVEARSGPWAGGAVAPGRHAPAWDPSGGSRSNPPRQSEIVPGGRRCECARRRGRAPRLRPGEPQGAGGVRHGPAEGPRPAGLVGVRGPAAWRSVVGRGRRA